MKKWLIAIIVAAAVSQVSVVWAGPGMSRGGNQKHGGLLEHAMQRVLNDDALAEELGVTQDQITTLSDYFYEHRQSLIKLQSDRQLAQMDVEHLLKQDNPDSDAVMKAVEHAGQIQTDIQKAQVEQTLKVKKVLGKETLAKVHEHFQKKMEERMQNNRDRGGREHREDFGPRGNAELQQQPEPMDNQDNQLGEAPEGDQPSWMDDEMLPPSPEELFSFKS